MTERIGIVGYLNARPLVDDLDRERFEVYADHPGAIARALSDGEVHLALAPVAAVLRDATLRIAAGWCIGAEGPVDSVLLVAQTPPDQWRRLVLDGESRTSAVLARILLAGPLAGAVADDLVIEEGPPGCALDVAGGTTAALVIGDAARCVPAHLTTRIDLAETWHDWTGLPFVFAVWAGRSDVSPELRAHVQAAGAQGVSRICERYAPDDHVYLAERLRYPLDDRALMGLRRFAALAAAAGWVDVAEPSLFVPAEVVEKRDLDDTLDRAAAGEVLTDADVRALAHASLTQLGLAAHQRRLRVRPPVVGFAVVEEGEPVPSALTLAPHADPESLADAALALRAQVASSPDGVRFRCAEPTAAALRAGALARLVLPARVVCEVPSGPQTVAQTGLCLGCDHFGTVVLPADAAGWRAGIREVERQIRAAGFEPVRDAEQVALPVHRGHKQPDPAPSGP